MADRPVYVVEVFLDGHNPFVTATRDVGEVPVGSDSEDWPAGGISGSSSSVGGSGLSLLAGTAKGLATQVVAAALRLIGRGTAGGQGTASGTATLNDEGTGPPAVNFWPLSTTFYSDTGYPQFPDDAYPYKAISDGQSYSLPDNAYICFGKAMNIVSLSGIIIDLAADVTYGTDPRPWGDTLYHNVTYSFIVNGRKSEEIELTLTEKNVPVVATGNVPLLSTDKVCLLSHGRVDNGKRFRVNLAVGYA